MDRAERQPNSPLPTADELESMLRQHVLDVWFPRSLDEQYGGFLCDFDRRWRPRGSQEKLLEFQARHTLFAAEASQAYPKNSTLRRAALHGFRYLRDIMWDSDSGGWFHRLDRAGRPLHAHTKHVHGAAYAIEACVAMYEAFGERGALHLAQQGFNWLEDHAHDRQHGGYFCFLKRDGSAIREAAECPWAAENDELGTPIGMKDTNVHSDLLETMTCLARATRNETVHSRLAELVDLIANKILLHFYFHADWTPVPHLARFGYCLQNPFRLLKAGRVLGCEAKLRKKILWFVDESLRAGWDRRHGGIFYAGPGSSSRPLHGHKTIVRSKTWWVQFECLRTLTAAVELDPENGKYREHLAAQWDYVRRNFIDLRHGGTYTEGVDGLPRWRSWLGRSLAPAKTNAKGNVWKDASHDGRAILYCLERARATAGSHESGDDHQTSSQPLAKCA